MRTPAIPCLRLSRCWFLGVTLALLGLLAGCHGRGQVVFANGQCWIDGVPASLAHVESQQAEVAAHVLSRQPLFVLITLLVVALAGMSHVEKLILLLSAGRANVKGLGERLRVALDRYRVHPVRYFGIVAATLILLVMAASAYIYLDADKRSSERALGMLQFCHISLRTQAEKGALDDQRQNLEAIQATAGDIRALVTKLPPQEQRKAQEIIDQMNVAIGQQGKLVTESLQRTDESNQAVREHTMALERGLSTVEADMLSLKMLPEGLSTLSSDVRGAITKLDAVDGKLGGVHTKLDALDAKDGIVSSKLAGIDGKLVSLDTKMVSCEARLTALEAAVRAAARGEKDPASSARPPDGGSPRKTL